jgi:hypothetical protein
VNDEYKFTAYSPFAIRFFADVSQDAPEKTQYLNAKAQSRQDARENVNLWSRNRLILGQKADKKS